MPKRGAGKSKRPTAYTKAGISKRSYERILKEADKARSRLRDLSRRNPDADYIIPDTKDYTIKNILERIQEGDTTRQVLRELRNLTAEKLRKGQSTIRSDFGYSVSPSEQSRIKRAVDKANAAIRKAPSSVPQPEQFSTQEIIKNITSKEALESKLSGLKQYTPKNIEQIVTVGDDQMTKAEYLEKTAILERENARREKKREELSKPPKAGFLIEQADVDLTPIDIENIGTAARLRRRAKTWSDPARVQRANNFLYNYEDSLAMFELGLRQHGMHNDRVARMLSEIRSIITKCFNDEELIDYISTRIPSIDIALISGEFNEAVSFKEIYDAWMQVKALL